MRESYKDPLGTFETNVQGTANVLDALRAVDSVRVAVAVTTDKVYENLEHHYPYRETDSLGGHDPYSASKAAAEMVISSYRDSFLRGSGVAVASARAGNVPAPGSRTLQVADYSSRMAVRCDCNVVVPDQGGERQQSEHSGYRLHVISTLLSGGALHQR